MAKYTRQAERGPLPTGDAVAMARPKVKYVECPHCEANFPLPDNSHPLPRHRAFSGNGLCPGSNNPATPVGSK